MVNASEFVAVCNFLFVRVLIPAEKFDVSVTDEKARRNNVSACLQSGGRYHHDGVLTGPVCPDATITDQYCLRLV